MTDFDDELRDALGGNGSPDAGRAEESAGVAMAVYARKLRKLELIAWAYLAACVALAVFSLSRFEASTAVKDHVFYGVIFLLAIESSVLIKLWYWVMNTKLGVLAEIKRLRLQLPATQVGSEEPALQTGSLGWSVRGRRWALLVAIIAVGFFVGAAGNGSLDAGYSVDGYYTVQSDGRADVISRMELASLGPAPASVFTFYSDSQLSDARCLDETGRELPVEVVPEGEGYRFRADLAEPRMPGEDSAFKVAYSTMGLVREEGESRVFELNWAWGLGRNAYEYTVSLPRDAEVVSVEPKPRSRYTFDGRPTLTFSGLRSSSEHFNVIVRYRVP